MIWPFWCVWQIPCGTSTLRCTPRALGARLVGLKLLTPRPRGIYVHSVLVEFDEQLDCGETRAREIPLGSFPFDPGYPSADLPPFELAWLPTRVIYAGGPGITLGFVNDTGTKHALLSRFIWEEP